MISIEIGQVLWFKIRFNNSDRIVSETNHPYLVFNIDDNNGILEVIQIDSIKFTNVRRLLHNKSTTSKLSPTFIISKDNPNEKVIYKDSFAQLDNKFMIENFEDIKKLRKVSEKLSAKKLKSLINKYIDYHRKEIIDENKQVYISKEELEEINKK